MRLMGPEKHLTDNFMLEFNNQMVLDSNGIPLDRVKITIQNWQSDERSTQAFYDGFQSNIHDGMREILQLMPRERILGIKIT
jgi:hypothetical protein